jgi:hypothetical protein
LTRYTLNFGGGRLNQYTKKGRGIMAEVIAYNNIRIDLDSDIIFMTVARYKLFMGNIDNCGMDAKNLYEHLQFTARMQGTNSIKANDVYLQKGLGFGKIKLKKAKAFLHKHGMIEYKQARNADGTLGEGYIIVHMATGGTNIVPAVQKTDLPVNRTYGASPQMLYRVKEMLYIINKEILPHWNAQGIVKHTQAATERHFKKRHFEIIQEYGTEKVIQAITLYSQVLKSELHMWTYRWPLWDFIVRGIDRFIPDADPLNVFRDKSKKQPSNPADDVARARAMVKEAIERGLVK